MGAGLKEGWRRAGGGNSSRVADDEGVSQVHNSGDSRVNVHTCTKVTSHKCLRYRSESITSIVGILPLTDDRGKMLTSLSRVSPIQ